MADLTASADIHGHAIDLALSWSDPAAQVRSLRVVRRRSGYPRSPDDGLTVLDLAELFPSAVAAMPWARVDRQRFLVPGSEAEGGLLQAELAQFYAGANDLQPSQVIVRVYDDAHGVLARFVISSVTSVTTTTDTTRPLFGLVTTITINARPGSGPAAPAGTLVVSTQPVASGPVTTTTDYTQPDPTTGVPPLVTTTSSPSPGRVDWTPVASTVTGASQAEPITITTASPHWLSTGVTVTISGVKGNTAANGTWAVVVRSPTTFDLVESSGTGAGAYTGGGTAVPAAASPSFFLQEEQRTLATVRAVVPLDASYDTAVVVAGAPAVAIRSVAYTEAQDRETGVTSSSIAVVDREPPTRDGQPLRSGLDGGITYYYAAWEDAGDGYPAAPSWTAASTATGDHGSSATLFSLLPAVHRYYDDPASGPPPGGGLPGSWQLRRFLQVVGPALDQARSLGEALRSLNDVFEARADVLPYLGHLIGWEVDRTQPTQRQRTDLLVAPEVFSTVGTVPNIEALVHRQTGWTCRAKEFVNNVFLTNGVEPIRQCEIWQGPLVTGGVLTLPFAQTQVTPVTTADNDSVDARPAVAAEPGGGAPWLFWHSTRTDQSKVPPSTRRQIWMARLDGSVPPRPVMQGAPDDRPGLTYSDESPAAIADGSVVRLFWSSNRRGSVNIWTRTLTNGVPGPATQLTRHPAGDHCPAVAKDAAGTVWLFWSSARLGTTDIWATTLQGSIWSSPTRITTGAQLNQMPAAFLDATSQLRLTWSADFGDRSRILQSVRSGNTWSAPVCVSSSPTDASTFRDQGPAAIQLGAVVWVFWSSNRDGIHRLWASQAVAGGWSVPVPVTPYAHEEREPAAFVDAGGALRLLFRSQQSGERFRSCTVDMSNIGAVQPGFFADRWHYTYSTATDPSSYYQRDLVGLYITPGETSSLDEADRVKAAVEPFRPLHVRFIWFAEPPDDIEPVFSPVDIGESYSDSADFLGPIGETYSVALPQWTTLHTNTLGDVTVNPDNPTDLANTLRRRLFYPPPT